MTIFTDKHGINGKWVSKETFWSHWTPANHSSK